MEPAPWPTETVRSSPRVTSREPRVLPGSPTSLQLVKPVVICVIAITKPDVIVLLPFKPGCRQFLGFPDKDLLWGLNVGLVEDVVQIAISIAYMALVEADGIALFQMGTSVFFVLFSYFERKMALLTTQVAPVDDTSANYTLSPDRVAQALAAAEKPELQRTVSDMELLQQVRNGSSNA